MTEFEKRHFEYVDDPPRVSLTAGDLDDWSGLQLLTIADRVLELISDWFRPRGMQVSFTRHRGETSLVVGEPIHVVVGSEFCAAPEIAEEVRKEHPDCEVLEMDVNSSEPGFSCTSIVKFVNEIIDPTTKAMMSSLAFAGAAVVIGSGTASLPLRPEFKNSRSKVERVFGQNWLIADQGPDVPVEIEFHADRDSQVARLELACQLGFYAYEGTYGAIRIQELVRQLCDECSLQGSDFKPREL